MGNLIHDAEYYRSRAAEARRKAEKMLDAECKRMMLSIVSTYEELAQRADERCGLRAGSREL